MALRKKATGKLVELALESLDSNRFQQFLDNFTEEQLRALTELLLPGLKAQAKPPKTTHRYLPRPPTVYSTLPSRSARLRMPSTRHSWLVSLFSARCRTAILATPLSGLG